MTGREEVLGSAKYYGENSVEQLEYYWYENIINEEGLIEAIHKISKAFLALDAEHEKLKDQPKPPPFSRTIPLSATICTVQKSGAVCPFVPGDDSYHCKSLNILLQHHLGGFPRPAICRKTFPHGIEIRPAR